MSDDRVYGALWLRVRCVQGKGRHFMATFRPRRKHIIRSRVGTRRGRSGESVSVVMGARVRRACSCSGLEYDWWWSGRASAKELSARS